VACDVFRNQLTKLTAYTGQYVVATQVWLTQAVNTGPTRLHPPQLAGRSQHLTDLKRFSQNDFTITHHLQGVFNTTGYLHIQLWQSGCRHETRIPLSLT